MGTLAKLWRGELPLYITFWFFGMIIGTVVSVFVNKYALEPQTTTGTMRIGWLITAEAYTGFMCVALWRSADKYKGTPIWSIGARIYSAILFMSFISFAVEVIKYAYK